MKYSYRKIQFKKTIRTIKRFTAISSIIISSTFLLSCSKEKQDDFLNISRFNCIVDNTTFQYRGPLFSPFDLAILEENEHNFAGTGKRNTYSLDITCYPKTNPPYSSPQSCRFYIKISDMKCITTHKKYFFSCIHNEFKDKSSFYEYMRKTNKNHCYIEFCQRQDTVKIDESISEIYSYGRYGFAEGYIEFTEIDKERSRTVGKFEVMLPADDKNNNEKLEAKGTFKLRTKVESIDYNFD